MKHYDIITVDWSPPQTKIWKHWIKLNCPNAFVHTIPDTKPIHYNWASGKLNCFRYPDFKTDKVLYLDTDTIVTKDPVHVFDDMGSSIIALSNNLTDNPQHGIDEVARKIKIIENQIDFLFPPEHFSSGMMALKREHLSWLYESWYWMMQQRIFKNLFEKDIPAGEIALMFVLASTLDRDQIYNIPLEVHGVLEKDRKRFGETELPEVMHYHNLGLLNKHGYDYDQIHCYHRGLERTTDKSLSAQPERTL